MWGKTLAFIVIILLVFGTLVAWVPDWFGLDVDVQDPLVVSQLVASNLIVYTNTGADNMTYDYSSLTDAPSPPKWNVSLPNNEYLEVWWGWFPIHGVRAIELRHVGSTWYGGWSVLGYTDFYFKDGSEAGPGILGAPQIRKEDLEAAWDSSTNSSSFTATSSVIRISIVFKPDHGYTDIGEAFDAGYLWYGLSYDWGTEETGFNVMSMVIKLATFEGLGIGVPGIFGAFLEALLSTFFYIAIAIVAYVVITAVIPLIGGAPDG